MAKFNKRDSDAVRPLINTNFMHLEVVSLKKGLIHFHKIFTQCESNFFSKNIKKIEFDS